MGKEGSTAWVDGREGVFKVRSRGLAFLELRARPPWPNYRLEAQVRHEENTATGSVGLGFAYREGRGGAYAGFTDLAFVDRGPRRGAVELMMRGARRGPVPRPAESRLAPGITAPKAPTPARDLGGGWCWRCPGGG
jgi:hypothetical protein